MGIRPRRGCVHWTDSVAGGTNEQRVLCRSRAVVEGVLGGGSAHGAGRCCLRGHRCGGRLCAVVSWGPCRLWATFDSWSSQRWATRLACCSQDQEAGTLSSLDLTMY